jgi:dihydrolipoamide dehydrogenase
MIIVGGGYIAVEFAHFFEAMGTKVTIVQRNPYLVPEEEPEISEALNHALSRRMKIYTKTEAVEVMKKGGDITVRAREQQKNEIEVSAQSLLIAAGRKSNADLLKVENTAKTETGDISLTST